MIDFDAIWLLFCLQGAGKTYTMGGGNIDAQTEEEFGIIPRAIAHMFDHMKVVDGKFLRISLTCLSKSSSNPWLSVLSIQSKEQVEFTVKVSYIEIYREELRDLLDLETSSKDLHIREDDKGNTGQSRNGGIRGTWGGFGQLIFFYFCPQLLLECVRWCVRPWMMS